MGFCRDKAEVVDEKMQLYRQSSGLEKLEGSTFVKYLELESHPRCLRFDLWEKCSGTY